MTQASRFKSSYDRNLRTTARHAKRRPRGRPEDDTGRQQQTGPSPGDPEQGAAAAKPDKEQVKPQSPKHAITCDYRLTAKFEEGVGEGGSNDESRREGREVSLNWSHHVC